jgi:two-component sensor histidine kinase
VALSVIATAAMAAMLPIGRDLPFLTFFPALVIASAWGRVVGGVASLATATLSAAFVLWPWDVGSLWAMAAFWIAGGLIVVVAAALSESIRELRQSHGDLDRAQFQLKTLVGELAHRNRNALFVVMAIVRQSAVGAPSAQAAAQIINARLEAMVRAQEVVVQSAEGAALRPLLEKSLAPFALDRFLIPQEPDVAIEGEVAMGLGLLFHELATNAVKHGALSTPDGHIKISWAVEEAFARLTWREHGGPAVATTPARKGFGSRLIEVALIPEGGRVEQRFEPDGVVCELQVPLATAGSARLPSTQYGAAFVDRLSSAA